MKNANALEKPKQFWKGKQSWRPTVPDFKMYYKGRNELRQCGIGIGKQ